MGRLGRTLVQMVGSHSSFNSCFVLLQCAWEVQIVVAQLCSYFYFPLGEMLSNFCRFLEYSPQNLTSAF